MMQIHILDVFSAAPRKTGTALFLFQAEDYLSYSLVLRQPDIYKPICRVNNLYNRRREKADEYV